MQEELEELRQEIDLTNKMLLEVLNNRQSLVYKIIFLKERLGMPLRIPEREDEMIRKIALDNKGPMKFEAVENVFRTIFNHSLDFTKKDVKE